MITPIFCVWILNFTMLDEQVYHATNKGFFRKKFHKFAVDLRKNYKTLSYASWVYYRMNPLCLM